MDYVDGHLFDGLHVLVGEDGSVEDEQGHPVLQLVSGQFWVSNHAHVLRMATDSDTRWLYYALRCVQIAPFRSGSVQPKLSMGNLKMVPLWLPPPDERRAMVEVLSALDDKIESEGHLMSGILSMAIGLYTAACAREAREVAVDDIAQFHNRRRVPMSSRQRAERVGPYPYYGATGVFGYVDDFLFDEVLVLVGEDGSVVTADGTPVSQYIWGKSWINNHAHPLTGRGISTELMFLAIRSADVRPIVTGAVQPKISMGNLKALKLKVPSGRELESLEARLAPLFALYRQLSGQSSILVRLRDVLLPEFLSGRVRVPEAESAVTEVVA